MLDCCEPLDVVKERGITFEKLGCLARCNGAVVASHHASASSETELRECVRRSAAEAKSFVMVSYSRKEFGQTGDGHFSPVSF